MILQERRKTFVAIQIRPGSFQGKRPRKILERVSVLLPVMRKYLRTEAGYRFTTTVSVDMQLYCTPSGEEEGKMHFYMGYDDIFVPEHDDIYVTIQIYGMHFQQGYGDIFVR